MKSLEDNLMKNILNGNKKEALVHYDMLLTTYENCFSKICKFRSIKNQLICINCVLYKSWDDHIILNNNLFKKRNDFIIEIDKQNNLEALYLLGEKIIDFHMKVNNKKDFYTSNKIVNQALNYIHNNLSNNITLEKVAKEVHISKSHLCNLFAEHTKCSFSSYLNNAKIEYSKQLLSTTSKSLLDIAFKCGFNSQSYFCSTFKKVEGVSPLQYKKSLAKTSISI